MATFIDTIPEETSWDDLYKNNSYSIRVRIRATAYQIQNDSWTYTIDLTEFYSYCKITDINLLGHTIDRVGGGDNKCALSFYFASTADKEHFILKFK